MASIRRERGEVRRASQAFRDLGVLLILLLLVFSVRFQNDDADPAVTPLPGGVQAAGHEMAEPPVVEPAAVPALATPDSSVDADAPPIAVLQEHRHELEMQTRVLVLTGETVRAIRLPSRVRFQASGTCSEPRVERLARS